MTHTVRDTALSPSCTPVKFSYNSCGVGAARCVCAPQEFDRKLSLVRDKHEAVIFTDYSLPCFKQPGKSCSE